MAAETAASRASGRTFSSAVSLSWLGFYRGGLHPALALVPIIPFLPHIERDPGLFVEAPDAHDTLDEFEHRFKRPVDVMLFFFGLVNAGVVVRQFRRGHLVRADRDYHRQTNRHPGGDRCWPRSLAFACRRTSRGVT